MQHLHYIPMCILITTVTVPKWYNQNIQSGCSRADCENHSKLISSISQALGNVKFCKLASCVDKSLEIVKMMGITRTYMWVSPELQWYPHVSSGYSASAQWQCFICNGLIHPILYLIMLTWWSSNCFVYPLILFPSMQSNLVFDNVPTPNQSWYFCP